MSRLSSGLPIFALSHHSETLQKLCLCRGVVPLFFDATAFDQDSVEARAIEFLLDGGYLQKGDSILLTKGEVMGSAGSTNIMKILPVRHDRIDHAPGCRCGRHQYAHRPV